MGLKKAKELRFTFEDAHGRLRVVYLQVQHMREGTRDEVVVQATSDGVPLVLKSFVDDVSTRVVKTESRM